MTESSCGHLIQFPGHVWKTSNQSSNTRAAFLPQPSIKGKRKGLDFAIAVVWREPQNHFCLTTIFQHSSKSKHLCYPNLPSAMRPAPHSDEIPPPVFTGLSDEREKMFHPKMQHFSVEDFKAWCSISASVCQLFSQPEVNNLASEPGRSPCITEKWKKGGWAMKMRTYSF